MSITTKTGDKGQSGLLGGARLPKTDARFAALGAIDELNAALGMAKAAATDNAKKALIEEFQRAMIALGAEAATKPEDFERFEGKFVTQEAVDELLAKTHAREAGKDFSKFELPGTNAVNAALHFARTVARRAERGLWGLYEAKGLKRELACVYLNRLSDLLWLMAEE